MINGNLQWRQSNIFKDGLKRETNLEKNMAQPVDRLQGFDFDVGKSYYYPGRNVTQVWSL